MAWDRESQGVYDGLEHGKPRSIYDGLGQGKPAWSIRLLGTGKTREYTMTWSMDNQGYCLQTVSRFHIYAYSRSLDVILSTL